MRDCELWDPEEIHSYITNCAAQNGITSAKALAEEAGVDPSTISRLKSGQIKNPNLIPMARLFYASGASMDKALHLPANIAASDEIAALRESEAQATAASEEAQREAARIVAADDAKDALLDERRETIEVARSLIRRKDRQISVLAALVAVLTISILLFITYDKLNPDIGWFRGSLSITLSATLPLIL